MKSISSFRPPQGRLFEAAQHGDWRPWLRLRGRGLPVATAFRGFMACRNALLGRNLTQKSQH